ncbi:hypothetical protein K493DRAFT_93772 [Basidiobolus meristosporus CBS 931.73]|uniref:Uncharacterized protein n=1 Tax=Basidiobolus meristosporus CBS 931.73 TaxID=1314790 RepID=A0A1Y1X799_9FUNG|nr:hypothetical protein K493DRAFT_93772 [Basidiobolus meristosporus CBS 931.73]|eukprot:ORX81627.1 hypothetical protein K493DRAFT_93772 [Basidiobolus meristosporus CBS 931.73]
MSTTEETKLIVETTIVETVEEVTQVIESSSEVTPAQIEMNPGNSQEEVSGSTNTDNQTKSEHVEDSKETVSTDEKSPENNSSEEPSQSVDHSSVSEQVADSNKQSPPAESRQQLGAADEKVENTNGVETRDASTQDSEDTKIISDEKEIPEDPLPNSESKESTEETVADKTSTNADEHEQTPMDIDQNGDKAPDTEAQPEASDNEAPEEGVFIVEAVVAHRKRAVRFVSFTT